MGKILKIREVGDMILEEVCKEVEPNYILSDEIKNIIDDLKETLEYSTGYGIACPQIGVLKRIIILKAKKESVSYEDAQDIPLTIMINPVWKKITDDTDIQYEGCMSVPNIRGKVRRYKEINVKYYNELGEKIQEKINGFYARLIQHECDHLDGIVFLDKVEKPHGFATTQMINKYDLKNKI